MDLVTGMFTVSWTMVFKVDDETTVVKSSKETPFCTGTEYLLSVPQSWSQCCSAQCTGPPCKTTKAFQLNCYSHTV